MRNARVAVVGAAGFVGQELLRQFETGGQQVTAVVRGLRELSVEGDFHAAAHADDLPEHSFDVVVNLAYPTSGATFEHAEKNRAIVDVVDRLVRDGGTVVHASSLAVFGMALDRPIAAAPVAASRDLTYVESKIAAEHLLAERQAARGLSLDIVRFGNVWGRASGAWAVGLVKRLLTGRPIGIVGAPGYSNATDVANAADYLRYLVSRPDRRPGATYYHLAEFSEVPWGEWAEPLARELGVEPVYADRSWMRTPDGVKAEANLSVLPGGVRGIYMRLAEERVAGSLARTAVQKLPGQVQRRLRSNLVVASPPVYSRTEHIVLTAMAGDREFTSVVAGGWTPPVDRQESAARVMEWFRRD